MSKYRYEIPVDIDISTLEKAGFIHKIVDNLYLGSNATTRIYNKMDIIINLDYPYNKVEENSIVQFTNNDPEFNIIAYDNYVFPFESEEPEPKTLICVGIRDRFESDLTKYLDDLVEIIDKSLKQSKKVLVHCHEGISRSSSIVIAYLIKHHNLSSIDALQFVQKIRPIVNPNEGFKIQLVCYQFKDMFKGLI